MRCAAGEKQSSTRKTETAEGSEHRALILRCQVKETVPCDKPVETAQRGKIAHVSRDPVMIGKTPPRHVDQCGGAINPADVASIRNQIACNRAASATADVQNLSSVPRHGAEKGIQPSPLNEVASTHFYPRGGVFLIESMTMSAAVGGIGLPFIHQFMARYSHSGQRPLL